MTADYRDLVIAELIASEAALLEELRELAADYGIQRDIAHVGVYELARVTALLARANLTIIALREELRRYVGNQIGRAA